MGDRDDERAMKRRQDAVRILAILHACGEPASDDDGVVAVLRGQTRLQAIDFWMRYPDYLANELLNAFEKTGAREYLATAALIFDTREPDLRWVPMVRYRFGAFEPLDDALSVLEAYGLARQDAEGHPGHARLFTYTLMQAGCDVLLEMAREAVEIDWYVQRAAVVATITGTQGGSHLKDRQYLIDTYAETLKGSVIARITDRVSDRLEELRGAA